jgi:hypothetical protein
LGHGAGDDSVVGAGIAAPGVAWHT